MFNNGGGAAPPPKPIGIFWDIENCSIPKGVCAGPLINHIRNTFVHNRLNHREFEFQIACDVTILRREVQEDIRRAGCVTLAHVSSSAKNSADEQLREAMKKFVDTHSLLVPIVVLISGDIDFVHDLRGYQNRIGCYVILLYGPSCSLQFRQGWNEIYDFRTFCNGIPNPMPNSLNATPTSDYQPRGRSGVGPHQSHSFQPNTSRGRGRGRGFNSDVTGRFPSSQTQDSTNNQTNSRPSNHTRGKARPRSRSRNRSNDLGQATNSHSNASGSSGNCKPLNPKSNSSVKLGTPRMSQSANNLQSLSNGKSCSPSGSGSERGSCSSDLNAIGRSKIPRSKHILMIAGLPGKMDYKILREQLQAHAAEVKGFVAYVRNGQGFITFRNKPDADAAVELFNGREIYGKKLRISFVERIPFDERPGLPKPTSKVANNVENSDRVNVSGNTSAQIKRPVLNGSTTPLEIVPNWFCGGNSPTLASSTTLVKSLHENQRLRQGFPVNYNVSAVPAGVEQAKEASNYKIPPPVPQRLPKEAIAFNMVGTVLNQLQESSRNGTVRPMPQSTFNVPIKVKQSKPKNECCIS